MKSKNHPDLIQTKAVVDIQTPQRDEVKHRYYSQPKDEGKSRFVSAGQVENAEECDCLYQENNRQIVMPMKQFRLADTSKESIRYSRFENTSIAQDSSLQMVTQSRCSQQNDSCSKSAQRYTAAKDATYKRMIFVSPKEQQPELHKNPK